MMDIILGMYLAMQGGWILFKYSYYVLMSDRMEPIMMEVIEKSRISSRHHSRRYRYVYRCIWKGKERTFIYKSSSIYYIGDTNIFLIDPLFGIIFVDEYTTTVSVLFGITFLLLGIGLILNRIFEMQR